MKVRQPDALDYTFIAAVTWLVYVQWSGRHALHAHLLEVVISVRFLASSVVVSLFTLPHTYYVGLLSLSLLGFIVLITTTLHRAV